MGFIREAKIPGGTWSPVSVLEESSLCQSDYDRLVALSDSMGRPVGGRPVLGVPMWGGDATLDENHCQGCQALLPDQATSVELLPEATSYRRGGRTHRIGRMRRLRVCRQCYQWWVNALHDPSCILGTSWRANEGAQGEWINPGHGDAVGYRLRERDAQIVRTTVEAAGRTFRVARFARMGAPAADEVVFVAAGSKDRATRFVDVLPLSARSRLVIVTQPDQLEDAGAALKLGASEILASPLSPQQVIGAFVRSGRQFTGRDPQSGLPIIGQPVSAYGLGCIRFTVAVRQPSQLLELALLTRRFLRGYDEVGSNGQGGLTINIYCDTAYQSRVAERLSLWLGRGVDVVATGLVTAARAS